MHSIDPENHKLKNFLFNNLAIACFVSLMLTSAVFLYFYNTSPTARSITLFKILILPIKEIAVLAYSGWLWEIAFPIAIISTVSLYLLCCLVAAFVRRFVKSERRELFISIGIVIVIPIACFLLSAGFVPAREGKIEACIGQTLKGDIFSDYAEQREYWEKSADDRGASQCKYKKILQAVESKTLDTRFTTRDFYYNCYSDDTLRKQKCSGDPSEHERIISILENIKDQCNRIKEGIRKCRGY